jgi:hypothetical protein
MKDVRLEEVRRTPFPDDLEAVHEGVRDAALRLDRRRPLRHACGVVGRTARQSGAGGSLGVEVESDGDVAARALGEPETGRGVCRSRTYAPRQAAAKAARTPCGSRIWRNPLRTTRFVPGSTGCVFAQDGRTTPISISSPERSRIRRSTKTPQLRVRIKRPPGANAASHSWCFV